MAKPTDPDIEVGRRRTYTPEEIRDLLDRCELRTPEALALATARLSDDDLAVVGRYLEDLARQYEALANDVERVAR